jgi:polar amino acid transport system substrate-binding protein
MRQLLLAVSGALALLAWFGLSSRATADDSVSFCFNDWPPYAASVGGEATGLSIDILREAARRAGLTPRFVALPWNRCLRQVENGAIDAAVDAAERPQFIHGEVSFSVYTNTFWVRDDDPARTFEQAARRGGRLGIVAGYAYDDALRELFRSSGIVVDRSVDDAAGIRRLAFGRSDIMVADFVSTLVFAQRHNLAIRPLYPAHSLDRLYPSFNRDRRALMAHVDRALRQLCDEGWIQDQYLEGVGYGLETIAGTTDCLPARVASEAG